MARAIYGPPHDEVDYQTEQKRLADTSNDVEELSEISVGFYTFRYSFLKMST